MYSNEKLVMFCNYMLTQEISSHYVFSFGVGFWFFFFLLLSLPNG